MTCRWVCHFLCYCSGISRNAPMRVDLLCGLPPSPLGGGGGGAYSSVPSLAHVHKHNKHTRFANAALLILHFCLFLFALTMSPEDIYLFLRVRLSLFGLFSGERLNRASLCLWCLDLIISDTDRLWKLSKQTEFIGSLDVWVVGLCSWDHHWIHYLRVEFWGTSQIYNIPVVWKNWNWLK